MAWEPGKGLVADGLAAVKFHQGLEVHRKGGPVDNRLDLVGTNTGLGWDAHSSNIHRRAPIDSDGTSPTLALHPPI
jgi:hypothetical protein